jgi:hypothetical protein
MFYFTYPKDAARVRSLMASRHGELIRAHKAEDGTSKEA